jgi:hypothetical protein
MKQLSKSGCKPFEVLQFIQRAVKFRHAWRRCKALIRAKRAAFDFNLVSVVVVSQFFVLLKKSQDGVRPGCNYAANA